MENYILYKKIDVIGNIYSYVYKNTAFTAIFAIIYKKHACKFSTAWSYLRSKSKLEFSLFKTSVFPTGLMGRSKIGLLSRYHNNRNCFQMPIKTIPKHQKGADKVANWDKPYPTIDWLVDEWYFDI